jgi:hypothetical protein
MAKLIVDKGKITKQVVFEAGTVSVLCKKAALSTTGDMGLVYMKQDDQEIILTFAQAKSLANDLIARCSF